MTVRVYFAWTAQICHALDLVLHWQLECSHEMVCMLRKLLECNCWSLNSGYGREIGSVKKGCCLESRGWRIFSIAREQRIWGENSCWEAGERGPDTWKAEMCFWTSSQAPSYASPKLSLARLRTGVRSRATSVAKKRIYCCCCCSRMVWNGLCCSAAVCCLSYLLSSKVIQSLRMGSGVSRFWVETGKCP